MTVPVDHRAGLQRGTTHRAHAGIDPRVCRDALEPNRDHRRRRRLHRRHSKRCPRRRGIPNRGASDAIKSGEKGTRYVRECWQAREITDSSPMPTAPRPSRNIWPSDAALQGAGGTGVAFGSVAAPGANVAEAQSGLRPALGKFGNLLIRAIALPGVLDSQRGFKALRRGSRRGHLLSVQGRRLGLRCRGAGPGALDRLPGSGGADHMVPRRRRNHYTNVLLNDVAGRRPGSMAAPAALLRPFACASSHPKRRLIRASDHVTVSRPHCERPPEARIVADEDHDAPAVVVETRHQRRRVRAHSASGGDRRRDHIGGRLHLSSLGGVDLQGRRALSR